MSEIQFISSKKIKNRFFIIFKFSYVRIKKKNSNIRLEIFSLDGFEVISCVTAEEHSGLHFFKFTNESFLSLEIDLIKNICIYVVECSI